MKIQRPDCMKTFRQGSVSIPLLALLDLVPVLAAVVRGGHQDPVGGHERTVAITELDRILGTLCDGLAAEYLLGPPRVRAQGSNAQNSQLCSPGRLDRRFGAWMASGLRGARTFAADLPRPMYRI